MASNFKIRNYIKAKSVKGLRRLMYDKQIQLGMAALAFDIVYAKGTWYAWYYQILNNDTIQEVADAVTTDN
jgi:hypothetical protein